MTAHPDKRSIRSRTRSLARALLKIGCALGALVIVVAGCYLLGWKSWSEPMPAASSSARLALSPAQSSEAVARFHALAPHEKLGEIVANARAIERYADVVHHDLGPLPRKLQRVRSPEAPPRTSDDHHASLTNPHSQTPKNGDGLCKFQDFKSTRRLSDLAILKLGKSVPSISPG